MITGAKAGIGAATVLGMWAAIAAGGGQGTDSALEPEGTCSLPHLDFGSLKLI